MDAEVKSVTLALVGDTYAILVNSLADQFTLLRKQADEQEALGGTEYAAHLRQTAHETADLLRQVQHADGDHDAASDLLS